MIRMNTEDEMFNNVILSKNTDQNIEPKDTSIVVTEPFPWGVRHIQTLLLFLCMLLGYALRVNMSVGIVAMTNKSNANENFIELQWNETARTTILSSFFWGYIVTQVYAGHIAEKYGGKHSLSSAIGSCGILTMAIPLTAIYGGVIGMCVNQICQGMAQGFLYPATNVLLSKWVPQTEKSRLTSFVYSGSQFGAMTMLPLAGLLASSTGGWPSIFYISGIVALVWALFWSLIGANSPADYTSISEKEKEFIISSSCCTTSKKLKTPWKKIFTSVPVWIVIIAHLGQNLNYWILLTAMPTYINYILKFKIKSNGFLSALPLLIKWLMIITFSWISDYINKLNIISNTNQRKMWNSIAHWGGALGFLFLSLFDTSVVGTMLLITATLGLNAGVYSGFFSSHMDLAPNFAGTLMGITNSFGNVASIFGPLLVGFIVTDSSNKEQWNIVFLLSATVFFIINLVYIIFSTAKVQPWNESPKKQNENCFVLN